MNNNNLNGDTRSCQIVLIDGRKLDFLIQPKLSTADLLDLVASNFNLKEKEYFGLAFIDTTGHRNWLQSDKKVLDHEFTKKPGLLVFHFAIRFFIENIVYLKEKITVELFFLQAKLSIFKSELETSSDKVFELASLVLQAQFGDYLNDEQTRVYIKKALVLPQKVIEQQVSLSFCEERVINSYKKLAGLSRGQAIVNYMTIVEHLPNYGIHYYEVKDKSNASWYLGISYKGISVYDYSDRIVPRKVFPWRHLENLYYRERKFSIEVHETKSIQVSPSNDNEHDFYQNGHRNAQSYRHSQEISLPYANAHTTADYLNNQNSQFQNHARRSQSVSTSLLNGHTQLGQNSSNQQNQVRVHAWFASQPSLCKSIWLMAVAQHQFYLDRKQCKANMYQFKSLNDLVIELSTSTLSLSGSLSSDAGSQNFSLSRANSLSSQELLEQSRIAKQEMWQLYKARKENLENLLAKKREELKEICVKEAEITGRLPKEYPLEKGEEPPVIKRKIGASYQFNQISNHLKDGQSSLNINELTIELEIQNKITNAALILASDPSANKAIRKQRREFYEKAREKLNKIEAKLNELKLERFNQLSQSINMNHHYNNNTKFCDDFVDLNTNTPKISNSIGHKSTPTSPVMIHRKESYRRAQQQKLTLEKANNENYQQTIPIQIQPQQQRQKTPILINKTKYTNDENESSNSTTNSYMNLIYGSTGLLLDNNNSSTTFNNSHNDPLNTSPHVIPDNITFRNRPNLHSQKSTSTLKTPVHQSNSQVAMLAAGYNSLERKNLARKNTTSDSNVKLLADHNFYHVAHKSDLAHKKIIDEKNEELFKNILFSHQPNNNNLEQSKPYEMSDYFKYSNKFKNQNQQNNSLLMINTDAYSQSTPTTPLLYDSLYVNKSNHNSPQYHFHANNRLPNNNGTHSQNHSHNSSAHNFSLNLSIHTAEEFGKEMLAWLHNENKNGSTSSQQQQQQQGTSSNTAATLV